MSSDSTKLYLIDLTITAERALRALYKDWQTNNMSVEIDEWTLRVHMGFVKRKAPPPPQTLFNNTKMLFVVNDRMHTFLDDVPAEVFLCTFQRLVAKAKHKDDVVTHSQVTHVDVNKNSSATHDISAHADCKQNVAVPMEDPAYLERAIMHGARVAFDACIVGELRAPVTTFVCPRDDPPKAEKRQTRSIVFNETPLWRVDFTRVDGGAQHRIEFQLLITTAYARCRKLYDKLSEKPASFDDFLVRLAVLQLAKLTVRVNAAGLSAQL